METSDLFKALHLETRLDNCIIVICQNWIGSCNCAYVAKFIMYNVAFYNCLQLHNYLDVDQNDKPCIFSVKSFNVSLKEPGIGYDDLIISFANRTTDAHNVPGRLVKYLVIVLITAKKNLHTLQIHSLQWIQLFPQLL